MRSSTCRRYACGSMPLSFAVPTSGSAREDQPNKGVARYAGFSLHAGIGVEADQRAKLERLTRYVSRPPVSVERLDLTAQGQRADVLSVEEANAGLQSDQVRELKQLREENARLKRLVAELSLDKTILQDVNRKNGPARVEEAGSRPVHRAGMGTLELVRRQPPKRDGKACSACRQRSNGRCVVAAAAHDLQPHRFRRGVTRATRRLAGRRRMDTAEPLEIHATCPTSTGTGKCQRVRPQAKTRPSRRGGFPNATRAPAPRARECSRSRARCIPPRAGSGP
jgi:hypothetical protein